MENSQIEQNYYSESFEIGGAIKSRKVVRRNNNNKKVKYMKIIQGIYRK